MIIWVALMIGLVLRLAIRPFYYSPLGFIISLAYIVVIIGIMGRARWGLFWICGTSIVSMLAYLIFKEGIIYTFELDIVLLILSIIAVFAEKKFNY